MSVCSANRHGPVKGPPSEFRTIFRSDHGGGLPHSSQRRPNGNMLTSAMPKDEPPSNLSRQPSSRGRAFTGWVNDALNKSGVSQAELGRQMSVRLGRAIDRSAINKLTTGYRSLLADEMLAVAAITGAPLPPVPGGGHLALGHPAPSAMPDVDMDEFLNRVAGALRFLGYPPEKSDELLAALLEFSRKSREMSGRPTDQGHARSEGETLAKLFSLQRPSPKEPGQT
jgi:hypothetical protein